MGFRTRLASGLRANTTASGPGRAGLGMTLRNPTRSGGRGPRGATVGVSYVTPGIPKMPDWDADYATRQLYQANAYVMRCVRTIADTIAGLPFRAGPDPMMPSKVNEDAQLAKLLGPASIVSPGGPNPTTSSRALWAWSIVQYLITGRFAWEQLVDPVDKTVFQLWPLVACCLFPIPSSGTPNDGKAKPTRWFDGFEYSTPLGKIDYKADEVFYAWRPSQLDWREPESDLQGARMPVQIVNAVDRYMWGLLRNDMVARKMVVTPPFENAGERRAFEESFLSEYTGFDNAGKVVFAEAENDYDVNGKMVDQASVQVIDLATKGIDAELSKISDDAKSDINIALGVPRSLIGDASQRVYANADAEYRNFWTLKILGLLSEFQDPINVSLAPRIGNDVGWFDLSNVAALQPPQIFQPPAIKDAIDAGVVSPGQAARLLNIPAVIAPGEDVSTAPVGEELAEGASVMARSMMLSRRAPGIGVEGLRDGWLDAPDGWEWCYRSVNTYTYREQIAGWGLVRRPREHLSVGKRAALPSVAVETEAVVRRIRERRSLGIRSVPKLIASGLAVKAADTGRVLMLQRSIADASDPARGMWEFAGGHIEPGEDSFDAAKREWQEEVGIELPEANVAGSWTSPDGVYRGHVVVVPEEAGLRINPERPKVKNPDNPGHKYQETAAWFEPEHLEGNPAVRDEVRKSASTWAPVIEAAQLAGKRSELDLSDLDALGDLVTAELTAAGA